jgi:D-nopaline dehydrogenase
MNYASELNARRIVETNESPAATKWVENEGKIFIKALKSLIQVSSYPVIHNAGQAITIPVDVNNFLAILLPGITIKPVFPIAMPFWSNYLVHAVPTACNLGRIPERERDLTPLAIKLRKQLQTKSDISRPYPFYFYGEGANVYVCRVQAGMDLERQALAKACGLKIGTLLDDNNGDYNTNYSTLREYNLAPSPHNEQHVCPDSIDHRYFVEEVVSLEQLLAIAKIVGVSMPRTEGLVHMIHDVREKEPFETDQYKKIVTFTRDTLASFGAKFAL